MLAESFMIDGSGYVWIGLGKGEREAVSHTQILASQGRADSHIPLEKGEGFSG